MPDRAALTGIVFVLKIGIQWEDLPAEMGCGSGMTCWRRLRDWQVMHHTRQTSLATTQGYRRRAKLTAASPARPLDL